MKGLLGGTIVLVLVLSGCAGISESDCTTLNWQQIGLENGLSGKDLSDLEQYQACEQHGINVNMDEYNQGFEQGIRTFCRAENGFDVGLSGYQYQDICPDDLAAEFVAEFNIGAQFYYVHRDITAIETALSSNQDTIDKLERGIVTNNLKLADDELDIREEVVLEQEIQSMESQIDELHRAAPRLQAALLQRQGLLEELKTQYGR